MDKNNVYAPKSKRQMLKKLSIMEHSHLTRNAILFAGVLFVIVVFIFYVRLRYPSWKVDSPELWFFLTDLSSVIVSLFATAVAVACLSIAIEKETKETFIDLMRHTVIESLFLKKDSINSMAKKQKEDVMRTIANNLVDNSHLVDFLMNTLEKSTLGWRSDIDYQAKLELNPDTIEHGFRYKLRQKFSYTQNYGEDQSFKERKIKIGFAFDNKILSEWLKEDDWFFRETLDDKYEGSTDEDLSKFINEKLNFELWFGKEENNAQKVSGTYKRINNHGIVIEYILPQQTNQFFAKIYFDNNRLEKHWLVTLPTLTKSATISCVFDDKKIKVDGYDFFTCNENVNPVYDNHAGICQFKMKDQWLFPVSGVMFVWDEISTSQTH